jgi:hypothetical protein
VRAHHRCRRAISLIHTDPQQPLGRWGVGTPAPACSPATSGHRYSVNYSITPMVLAAQPRQPSISLISVNDASHCECLLGGTANTVQLNKCLTARPIRKTCTSLTRGAGGKAVGARDSNRIKFRG